MAITSQKPLAVVSGASSGIGLELAKLAARDGHDLIIAADTDTAEAEQQLAGAGANVTVVRTDLSTREGVRQVIDAVAARPIALLFLNAGQGLGRGFMDQPFDSWKKVVDTNITGTLDLFGQLGKQMADAGRGRILFTGSIAGLMPGSFQAVYNGTKAFIDSFAIALRNELKESGVTVTLLMPGATDTEFFVRAGMQNTKVGADKKQDPASVAKAGYQALMAGKSEVVAGAKNKAQAAMARVLPDAAVAQIHRGMSQPGTDKAVKAKSGLGRAVLPALAVAGAAAFIANRRSATRYN